MKEARYGQDELIIKQNCIEIPAIYYITEGSVEIVLEASTTK